MDENQNERGEFIARIGTFIVVLGSFFLILFLASDFAKAPDFDWLFLGTLALIIGFVLRRRATPPSPAGRFGMIRSMREKAKQRREEKYKKAQKK